MAADDYNKTLFDGATFVALNRPGVTLLTTNANVGT